MAARFTEMRMVLILQNQASFALGRVARDLKALESLQANIGAASAAQAEQIMRAREKASTVTRKLANDESQLWRKGIQLQAQKLASEQAYNTRSMRMMNQRAALERQQFTNSSRFAQQRMNLANKEMTLQSTQAAKARAISTAMGRIAVLSPAITRGEGGQFLPVGQRRAAGSAVQQLETSLLAAQMATAAHVPRGEFKFSQQRLQLEAQSLRQRAQRIGLEGVLKDTTGTKLYSEAQIAQIAERGMVKVPGIAEHVAVDPGIQQAALRYQALLKDIERTKAALGNITVEQARWNEQIQILQGREGTILAQMDEQKAKLAREQEALGGLLRDYKNVQTKLAQIAEEQARITENEKLTEQARIANLRLLDQEAIALKAQQAAAVAGLDAQKASIMEAANALEIEKIRVAEINAEVARLGENFTKAGIEASAAADKAEAKWAAVGTAGRTASHVGRAGMLFGGVGLLAGGVAANAFANFNLGAAKAATQMRGVDQSFVSTIKTTDVLENQILKLTRIFPAAAKDMADSAYQIASGMDFTAKKQGVVLTSNERLAKTMQLVKAANMVAAAGQTDLKSATDTVITAFNNFDPHIKNVNGLLNQLFAIVRFGRGDFTQFTSVFGRIAGAAHAAGQTLQEAGGALAYLTQVLPRGAATAGLARLFQIMQRPEFVQGMKALGMPITMRVNGVDKLKNLSDIIGMIRENLGKGAAGGIALSNVIAGVTAKGQQVMHPGSTATRTGLQGTQQARLILTDLVKGYPQYADTLRNIAKDNNEFSSSWKAIQQTPGFKWQVAIAQFKALGIVVGQYIIPYMIKFVDVMVRAVHWFENLPAPVKNLIVMFTALGAIITFLGGTFGVVLGSLISLIVTVERFSKFIKEAGAASRLASIGMAGIWVAIAIAAALAVMWIITHWQKFKAFWAALVAGAKALWADAMTAIVGYAEAAAYLMIQYFEAPLRALLTIVDILHHPIRAIEHPIATVKNAWKGSGGAVGLLNALNKELGVNALGADAKKNLSKVAGDVGRAAADAYFTKMHGGLTPQAAKIVDAANKIGGSHGAATIAAQHHKKANTDLTTSYDKLLAAQLTDAKNTAFLNYLQNLATNATNHNTNATNLQTTAINAHAAALNKVNTEIKSMTANLGQYFDDLMTQYQQAAGTIFQGPIMQGPLGSAFTQIQQTLAGFGVNFKIPAAISLKDMQTQDKFFNKWQNDILKIQKSATKMKLGPDVTAALVSQIRQGGIANIGQLEGLLSDPKRLRQFLAGFKEHQGKITAATKAAFQSDLHEWLQHGKDAALQFILGLRRGIAQRIAQGLLTGPEQAAVMKEIKAEITKMFAGEFKKQVDAQVAAAVKKREQTDAAKAAAKNKGTTGGSTTTGKTGGGKTHATVNNNTFHIHADNPTKWKRAMGSYWSDAGLRTP